MSPKKTQEEVIELLNKTKIRIGKMDWSEDEE